MTSIQPGVILSVNTLVSPPTVNIKTFPDGSVIKNVTLDGPREDQHLPEAGNTCHVIREGNYITKVLKYYASSTTGQIIPSPGEKFIGGPTGASTHIGSQGVTTTDPTGTAISSVTNQGFHVLTDEVTIHTVANSKIDILDTGDIVISKYSPFDDTQLLSTMTITAAGQIYQDGVLIYLGPGASNTTKNALFGNVVTSGPAGTYPFDFVTGLPIPGSKNVLAESTPNV